MPYPSISDLPEPVRAHLPLHAQEIFRAAFNDAWARHANMAPGDLEAAAHRIAWAAVKRRYRKRGEQWIERGAFDE
jgi:cation transport regulator